MRHLSLNCKFYVLFKWDHLHIPILWCTNFECHLVTKCIFHALTLTACHPILIIIIVIISTCILLATSVYHRLSTDTYYRLWPDHLLTTTTIEVCMLNWLPLGMGHDCCVDTCICATVDFTSISLECVHNGPTAHHAGLCPESVRTYLQYLSLLVRFSLVLY